MAKIGFSLSLFLSFRVTTVQLFLGGKSWIKRWKGWKKKRRVKRKKEKEGRVNGWIEMRSEGYFGRSGKKLENIFFSPLSFRFFTLSFLWLLCIKIGRKGFLPLVVTYQDWKERISVISLPTNLFPSSPVFVVFPKSALPDTPRISFFLSPHRSVDS